MKTLIDFIRIINESEEMEQHKINPQDVIKLDVPLLIRLLEYAREDAKTDMDLHNLTENLIAMSSEAGRTLNMHDYDTLVSKADNESQ